MQTSTAPSSKPGNSTARGPHSAETSFAGVLASIAAPPKPETAWIDSELAEDVATISYEKALRTHARLHPSDANPERQPASLGDLASSLANSPAGEREFESAAAAKPARTASITIRLSERECAHLRQRAAEAGLTVSAYLRSCTLEVESLRAQVKNTLAQLRAPKPASTEPLLYSEHNPTRGFQHFLASMW